VRGDLRPEVLASGFAATECPRWKDGVLFFSDMHGHAVHSVDASGEVTLVVEIPETPGGLGWLPDGSLLVVGQSDRTVRRFADGQVTVHADLSHLGSSPLNDMHVSPSGRAYVGEMGFDLHGYIEAQGAGRTDGPAFQPGRVFLVEPDGTVRPATDHAFLFPNGIIAGPGPDQLLVAESFGSKLTVFDIHEDGTLHDGRLWAQLEVVPDGIALDDDGHVWVADPVSNQAVLVAEGGQVLDVIKTDQNCLAVELGGTDRRTLFLCTTPDINPQSSAVRRGARIETVPLGL
jgi:sugar lactone lactonase YvrE